MTGTPIYRLRAYGTPQPKGSMKCVGARGRGHHTLIEDDKTGARRTWRAALTAAATCLAARLDAPLDGPLIVGALFHLDKPASSRTALPTTRSRGDVDKHARMALDCLTDAAVIHDDSRIVGVLPFKIWAEDRPGATLWVARAAPGIPGRILTLILNDAPALTLND